MRELPTGQVPEAPGMGWPVEVPGCKRWRQGPAARTSGRSAWDHYITPGAHVSHNYRGRWRLPEPAADRAPNVLGPQPRGTLASGARPRAPSGAARC
jgi:hypothetical protein